MLPSGSQIDEQLVQASGKFLVLDRMLPELRKRGHKVSADLAGVSFFQGEVECWFVVVNKVQNGKGLI